MDINLIPLQKKLFDSTHPQVILQGNWAGKTFATRAYIITRMMAEPRIRATVLTKDRFVAEMHLNDFSYLLDSLDIHHKVSRVTRTISFNDSHIDFSELNDKTRYKLSGREFSVVVVENISGIKNELVQATKCLSRVGKDAKWIGISYSPEEVVRDLHPAAEIIIEV